MNIEIYSKHLQELLQSKIKICCNTKTLKVGRLKLFTFKQYFIRLFIEVESGEMRVYELPYPFKMTTANGQCELSYKIRDLTGSIQPITRSIESHKTGQLMRMFDNIVRIIPLIK